MSDKDQQFNAETLRTMLASSGTGLWDWQIDKGTVYYSDEWLALVGMPSGVFEARIDFRNTRIHPDDALRVRNELDSFLNGRSTSAPYTDFRIKHTKGSWVQVRETIGITERDAQGKPTRVTGMMHDNSAAKTYEKRLEDECQYRRYTSKLVGSLDFEWDLVNDCVRSESIHSKTLGGTIAAFEGPLSSVIQTIHPEDRPLYQKSLAEYLQKGEGKYEQLLRMLAGPYKQYLWVIIYALIIERDESGKPTKLIGCTLNVDKDMREETLLRTKLEESIRWCERLMADIERSEETRKSMFKNSPHICIMFDSTFQVIDCNPAALEFFGFANVDDFRRDFIEFIAQAIPKRQPNGTLSFSLADRLEQAIRDGTHEFETELVINGEYRPISAITKKVDHMGGFALMSYVVDLRKNYETRRALHIRDRLLQTINKMSFMLMTSDDKISIVLQKAIVELGVGADADIAYVLKNEELDRVLYCSILGAWATTEDPHINFPLSYDLLFPGWRDTLAQGKILKFQQNDIAKNHALPDYVSAQIKISLNIPLFVKNKFWGTVGFSRREDRAFIKAEEDLLQSAGILIASAILHDEMTENLLEANRAAIAGIQAKTDFLSQMSHEIRTPMNAIIGMTALAQKANDISRVQYCLNQIGNSSRQLLGIINNVLDMSKIEANKFEIISEEFVFENMIQHVFSVVQVKMDEKGQEFSVDMEDAFTRTVISDELRLSQVLINLLTNAIKFTPDGGRISLSIQRLPIDADTARLHIIVADTGIGITDEQKTRVFRLFEQAESSTSRRYGGTGLGLSISKSIVNLMGGDIWIEDNPGGGSKFIFEIIIKWGKVCRANKLPETLSHDLSILVIDDDKDMLSYFESILSEFSLRCDMACSGEEALEMVKRCAQNGNSYNLIFLDWKMPDMDGAETAAKIINTMGGTSIIVMISAASHNEVMAALNPLGVTHFLPKPILPSALYNTILSLIGQANQMPSFDESEAPSYNWNEKRLLLAEDVELNREVVIGILEETGITIECAENGTYAVQLFTKNDYDIVLMDIQMPVMDGFEATRTIRKLEKPNAAVCPIIAMTANAFKEDVYACLAAGMNDHIAKPIDVKYLFSTLSKYLDSRPVCF
ncbi:MAG: response regulator [Spirochaetaceae bacterium]|jgi:signal transduction histidine kinase/DNA-binding response OmpR family regulator/PAS domain-containing protein|nr:response regulator [Spirochaetaceae bacterium]